MSHRLAKLIHGYSSFRQKYACGDENTMASLADHGQKPETMVVACCDSRVDPALLMQCEPGDLFVLRNVANIVPPYEKDDRHHGTSAALEFAIQFLKVKQLIILGHSQCGGIQALLKKDAQPNDFIDSWVSAIKTCPHDADKEVNQFAKEALTQSYRNCLTFPWISDKISSGELMIHLWFFDIREGRIFSYDQQKDQFLPIQEIIPLVVSSDQSTDSKECAYGS